MEDEDYDLKGLDDYLKIIKTMSLDEFRECCILGGCDYMERLEGIGI